MLNSKLVYLLVPIITYFIVTRHDIDHQRYIVDPDAYHNVIQLQLKDLTGIVEMEGTFIDEKWIVTAAHGLTSVDENQTIEIGEDVYSIQNIILYPDWEGLKHDIALIELDREVPGINPSLIYKNEDELHQRITIVGRGWHGTGLTGPVSDDRVFRMATNRIDSVSRYWISFRFNSPYDENVTELEGISGPGDSGGPAFIEINGVNYLAGISSHQINEEIGIPEGHYGVIENYTRVSNYVDWIENTIQGVVEDFPNDLVNLDRNFWGFSENEIGEKASLLMDALTANSITDIFMEEVFYKDFRESFDLKGFVQGMADRLHDPAIEEIRRARRNVLIFTIKSDDQIYLIQLDADRRDGYKIGGLVFRRLND